MKQNSELPWSPADVLEYLRERRDQPILITVSAGNISTLSCADLRRLTFGAANALRETGAERGDVIAIWAPNGPGWIAAGLACHYLGAILAPIDSLLPPAEASEQAVGSGAKLLLVHGEAPEALQGRIPTLDLLRFAPANDAPPPAGPDPESPIALFRTSGTTGAPKVFHLTLRNIGCNVRAIAESGLVGPADRILMPLPLHHVFPWITATLVSMSVGAVLILPESPTGPHIAEALRLGRPSILVGVPRLFEAMLVGIRGRIRSRGRFAGFVFDSALSLSQRLHRTGLGRLGDLLMAPVRRAVAPGLNLLVSGGARLPVTVEEELDALGWDLRIGYGLAETASSIAGTVHAKRRGSVGHPLPGCEIRIAEPDPDGTGEILVRGPVVFGGYLDNPKVNVQAFTPDGFFRTGDLGRVDEDGFLYVTGRKRERIVLSGGDKLYPEDVEREYLASPMIAEIGVFERDGRLLALIVPSLAEVAKTGSSSAEDAIRVDLAGIAKRLPSTWRLAGFALTREPLPRTRLDKIRRFLLPELYERARSGGSPTKARPLTAEERAWAETPPRAAVWSVLTREHSDVPIDLDTNLQLDLGFDSFGWMTLGVAIEQATGARLDATDMAEIATVRDLLARVTEKAEQDGRRSPDRAEVLAGERTRWLSPPTAGERLLGRLLHILNAALMRLVFRLRATGAERLPSSGPVVLCPNHVSDLDPFVLEAALPPSVRNRVAWAAARSRLFRTPLQRRLARAAHAFPVDETAPMSAIALAVESLSQGRAQVWFPEGWRSPDGRLLPFQPGIGHILMQTTAPAVPVLIRGTLKALPMDRRLPRLARVSVTFGEPVPASELIADAPSGEAQAQGVADALRGRLMRLAEAGER